MSSCMRPCVCWSHGDIQHRFASYKTLSLSFRIEQDGLEQVVRYCNIPSSLSASFPCLVDLSIDLLFPYLATIRGLWNECYFPALRNFSLPHSPTDRPPLTLDDLRPLASFLSRHTITLRALSLPCMSLPPEAAPLFSRIPWTPHHLRACLHVVNILGQSSTVCASLQTLDVSFLPCPHREPLTSSFILGSVHTLTVNLAINHPLWWSDIPRLVPGMRTIEFQCSAAVSFLVFGVLLRVQLNTHHLH